MDSADAVLFSIKEGDNPKNSTNLNTLVEKEIILSSGTVPSGYARQRRLIDFFPQSVSGRYPAGNA